MTSTISALNTRMDDMEGGRKKNKVAIHLDSPSCHVAAPEADLRAPPGLPATYTSWERLRVAPRGSVPTLLPSISQERPEMAPTESLPPCLQLPPALEMESARNLPSHLTDVSDAVRARVAEQLLGAPIPFLLTKEHSPLDEEASPVKRRRHTVQTR